MTTTALKTKYTIKIKMIEFDFSGYDWEDNEYTQAEWDKQKADTTKEWTNKTFVYEAGVEELEDPEEDFFDEILPRKVCDYISNESGWCITDIRYEIA